jgi:hypothetical protein
VEHQHDTSQPIVLRQDQILDRSASGKIQLRLDQDILRRKPAGLAKQLRGCMRA